MQELRSNLRFVVGCKIEEFMAYYKEARGTLNDTEKYIISQDPKHLIVWKDNGRILGHAIWHESNLEEHRKGVPREEKDKEFLQKLLGGRKEFAELHELWLKPEHRGKGFGKKFFDFFEGFISNRGFEAIIYYTNDPAALAMCRRRGYKEAYGLEEEGEVYYVLCLLLKNE